MSLTLTWWLLPALALVALLYASVGYAGASGYIAVLALVGLPAAARFLLQPAISSC